MGNGWGVMMKWLEELVEEWGGGGRRRGDVGKGEGGMVKEGVKKGKDVEEEEEERWLEKMFGKMLKEVEVKNGGKWKLRREKYEEE